jgi:hypothetical protein
MLDGCADLIKEQKKLEEDQKKAEAVQQAGHRRKLDGFLKTVEKPGRNARISFEISPNSTAVAEKEFSGPNNVTIFAAPMGGHSDYTHCFRIFEGMNGTAVIGIDEKTYQRIVAASEKQMLTPISPATPNSKQTADTFNEIAVKAEPVISAPLSPVGERPQKVVETDSKPTKALFGGVVNFFSSIEAVGKTLQIEKSSVKANN